MYGRPWQTRQLEAHLSQRPRVQLERRGRFFQHATPVHPEGSAEKASGGERTSRLEFDTRRAHGLYRWRNPRSARSLGIHRKAVAGVADSSPCRTAERSFLGHRVGDYAKVMRERGPLSARRESDERGRAGSVCREKRQGERGVAFGDCWRCCTGSGVTCALVRGRSPSCVRCEQCHPKTRADATGRRLEPACERLQWWLSVSCLCPS